MNEFRTEQFLPRDRRAEEIATACPFCTSMFLTVA